MRELCRLVIPFDVHRTSPNQRLHWAERDRRNQAARYAAFHAWRRAGEPRSEKPVRVSLLIRRGKKLDADNAVACVKPIFDQLFNAGIGHVRAGIVPNDGCKWVELGMVRMEGGKRWRGREEVVVIVEVEDDGEAG